MQALHPIFADITSRWIAPPSVTCTQTRFASPFEIEFRGRDQEAVQAAARRRADGIDAYRSPAVSVTRLDGDEWVTTLRFYSAD